MSRIDAQSNTGDSQPVTTVAMALPADPSRAEPKVRIHHHGSEARTVIIAAPTLRTSGFMTLQERLLERVQKVLVYQRSRRTIRSIIALSPRPPISSPPRS